MRVYIIRRLLKAIPTLLLITLIGFLLVRFNTVESIIREMLLHEVEIYGDENLEEDLKEMLGLDQPLLIQYGRWLGVVRQKTGEFSGILQFDLGESLWRR